MLGVSRQGYYAFAKRSQSRRAREDQRLEREVQASFERSSRRYGSPRVLHDLRNRGLRVSKRRIERAMRNLGISARPRRGFRVTTRVDAEHPKAPNIVNRNFEAEHPDQVWVGDITYIRTRAGWCYLAVLLDLCSRAVVGWALGTEASTELSLRALEMAITHRRPKRWLLHHTDQGCQYTSGAYRVALSQAGIEASMSRRGNCWDNAVAESFFATLKTELIHRQSWADASQLRHALFEYIEVFYNRQRLHSTLGYRTPAQVQFELNAASVV